MTPSSAGSVPESPAPLAHSANAAGLPHALVDHLLATADGAGRLAIPLDQGTDGLARLGGLLHDLAKAPIGFQDYLAGRGPGVVHALPGAIAAKVIFDKADPGRTWATKRLGLDLLAMIAGHHAGLRRPVEVEQEIRHAAATHATGVAESLAFLAGSRDLKAALALPPVAPADGLEREMMVRMAFSCLIDADRLDTEAHFQGAGPGARRSGWIGFDEAMARFRHAHDAFLQQVPALVAAGRVAGRVADLRRELHDDAVAAASLPPGLFRLRAPTGAAKTRAYLAFAHAHAAAHPGHGFRRLVVALPFLSITDQVAQELRATIERDGAGRAVLEHHSQAGGNERDQPYLDRLAEENWDAPVVVTTFVQLFESLLAADPGRTRRLHALARSIIVIDEVQALPTGLTAPALDTLRLLARCHGATVVLSTATQATYERHVWKGVVAQGQVREIVRDPDRLRLGLQRVRYDLLGSPAAPLDFAAAAAALLEGDQGFAVMNTRARALRMLDEVASAGGDPVHLSTLLCPAHRREVLEDIRGALARHQPVHLVSTQVIEAGVDLDFRRGMREIGPLSSILQAGGRVNRNGLMAEPGQLSILFLEGWDARLRRAGGGRSDPDAYALETDAARIALLDWQRRLEAGERIDLDDPEILERYFGLLLRDGADVHGIQRLRQAQDYREVARLFRLIPEEGAMVVVDWRGQGFPALDRHLEERSRETARALQPFIVQLPMHKLERAAGRRLLAATPSPSYWRWTGPYDAKVGIGHSAL